VCAFQKHLRGIPLPWRTTSPYRAPQTPNGRQWALFFRPSANSPKIPMRKMMSAIQIIGDFFDNNNGRDWAVLKIIS